MNNNILDLECILDMYDNDDKSLNISDIISCIRDTIECREEDFRNNIRDLYTSIIYIKYYSSDVFDIGCIHKLFKSISWLHNETNNGNSYVKYYIPRVCVDIYNELKITYDVLPDDMIDEFSLDNLTNIKYHLDNFKRLGKNDLEFVRELDKELWRYV